DDHIRTGRDDLFGRDRSPGLHDIARDVPAAGDIGDLAPHVIAIACALLLRPLVAEFDIDTWLRQVRLFDAGTDIIDRILVFVGDLFGTIFGADDLANQARARQMTLFRLRLVIDHHDRNAR